MYAASCEFHVNAALPMMTVQGAVARLACTTDLQLLFASTQAVMLASYLIV